MKKIVMLGTGFDTMGGISSVVKVYRSRGFFSSDCALYVPTHCDGGAGAKLRVMLAAFFKVLCLAVLNRIGLLHVHTSSRASFWRKCLFFAVGFVFRIPVVLHLHGSEFAVFYDQECSDFQRYLIRQVFDRCARVVVLSDAWMRWVKGMCSNPKVMVMYNPVLLPAAVLGGERLHGDILFLGRLGERKGSYDLLAASAQVARAYSDFKVLMGGDGELEEVSARALELGVDSKIELLGWVRGEDKERLLREAMMYVLPSYNEGLPMSVLEAMAAGLPIISTPVGGIPEAVTDGVEGFLVQPGDVDALADRIGRLLADPGLARRMGEAARRKVETTFSAEVLLPQLEAMYAEFGFSPRPAA